MGGERGKVVWFYLYSLETDIHLNIKAQSFQTHLYDFHYFLKNKQIIPRAYWKKNVKRTISWQKILFCLNENVLSEQIFWFYEFQSNYFWLSHLKLSLFTLPMSKYFILVLLKCFLGYIVLQCFVTMKYIQMVAKKNILVMSLQWFHINTF